MEELREILLDAVDGGFWRFIGYWILIAVILGVPAKVIMFLYNRTLRFFNLMKNGYPPKHVDADGDFKKEKKNETNT